MTDIKNRYRYRSSKPNKKSNTMRANLNIWRSLLNNKKMRSDKSKRCLRRNLAKDKINYVKVSKKKDKDCSS
jgi:hypothetical protein